MSSENLETMGSATYSQRLAALFKDVACNPTADHDEGPYYRPGAPQMTDLYPTRSNGRVLYFHGSVTDTNCQPLSGATGEIWQADERGHYDNDDPGRPPDPTCFRCRASFVVASDGTFRLRTVLPENYSVCDPSGPWKRVKHLHFKFYAPGFQPLTTEIALLPDEYIASDLLFCRSLVAELQSIGEENGRAAFKAQFRFVLKATSSTGYVLAAARTKLLNERAGGGIATGTVGTDTWRKRHIVRRNDTAIEVIAEGAGPLILILPSTGRDSEDFDDVACGLAAAGFRVLRPQPRGIGCSVGPMQGLTLHDLARDVAAVIDQEGQGPAILVGHAFGNWVARMTAVNHPGLVRGLVLTAAAAKQIPQELRGVVDKCANSSLPDAERMRYLQFAFFALGHDPSSWLSGWYPETMESQRQAGNATPQKEWWSGGTAPILDLQAGQDPWRPRETANELRDEFGDRVSVVVVRDASHALLPEQPAAVVNEIVAWARKL
jgi:protocatechuate 3,4-dioxygenase beta subunit/pimeloyl-ACP methyl ester carboxylesterase